jgi:DNA-binding MarR family transcriptional regulator
MNNNSRMKAAMVIYSLEQALAEFVRKNHASDPENTSGGTFSKISVRESLPNDLSVGQKVEQSIAASYFEEVLSLAIESSKSCSSHEHTKVLKTLLDTLEAFNIRNCISHPNREFPDCYWYRTAAIAADPVIDKLNFNDVKAALKAAEENKIIEPPEDWLIATSSYVPNNLPEEFEHEHTGLIGRQSEKKYLISALKSGRYHLLSVIAPGGLGKTALTLDVLRESSLDPTTMDWCDGIAFISLKQEKLTANGIEKLSAVATIEEIKEEILETLSTLFPSIDIESFEQSLEALKQKKVLLCLDNLETLLRDTPELFDSFYEALPTNWRVLITSRVTVDGAKSIALGALQENGARSLIYKYFNSKGMDTPVEDDIKKIIKSSSCNPLAIRLTVDRYQQGYALINASSKVSKDIVSFSYRNLIETLSDDSIMILECLFVRDRFSRGELIELLNLDTDRVAEAVRGLTSTSLVKRETSRDDEQISLSPSVRDLLREHPKNIRTRDQVRKLIDRQAKEIRKHHSIQKQHKFSYYHEDFIPKETPQNLSAILIRSIRILRSNHPAHSQVVVSLDRLVEISASYDESRLTHQTLARLYLQARDDYNAAAHFKRAVEIETDTPTSRLLYAQYLLQREQADLALEICESLIEEKWDEISKCDEITARRVVNCYFRSLSELDRNDDIIRASDKYENDHEFRPQTLTSKSHAIISNAERLHNSEPSKALTELLKAARLLKEIPTHDAVYRYWCNTSRHLLKEIRHLFNLNTFSAAEKGKLIELLTVCDLCLKEGGKDIFSGSFGDELTPIVNMFQSILEGDQNPFLTNKTWKQLTGIDQDFTNRVDELISKGYMILTVCQIPRKDDSLPGFIFAECPKEGRLFITRGDCVNLDLIKWAKLIVGSKMAAKGVIKSKDSGHCPKPEEVILL